MMMMNKSFKLEEPEKDTSSRYEHRRLAYTKNNKTRHTKDASELGRHVLQRTRRAPINGSRLVRVLYPGNGIPA